MTTGTNRLQPEERDKNICTNKNRSHSTVDWAKPTSTVLLYANGPDEQFRVGDGEQEFGRRWESDEIDRVAVSDVVLETALVVVH